MTKWVAVLLMALLMAGCGGADDPAKGAVEFAGRMRAAGVVATSESTSSTVTADMTLDWAEYNFADLFPKALGQRFPDIEYLGVVYNARAYVGPWGTRYLGITPDGRIFGLGDFTNDVLQQFDDVDYWAARVLADQCKVSPDSCGTVSLAAGGEISLNDGVSLLVLEGSGSGDMAVYARASGGQPGQIVGESRLVSYHYTITSNEFRRGGLTAPMRVSIPVAAALVPPHADPTDFDVQVYNPQTQEWKWVDGWAVFEPGTNTVSFWADHFSEYRVVHSVPSDQERYSRWRVNYDNFSIIYYTPKADTFGTEFLFAPPPDASWRPVGGGVESHPEIWNYVEDLNKALDTSLSYYLTIQTSTQKKLFGKPASAPFVRVTHLPASTSGGESKWGMMRIATTLNDYSELRRTATHELFHVLSDQYYTVFGAAYNRWFFEASADLWTSRALGMTREQQRAYLGREMVRYLKVSLDASDESSYYAAADFLDWLEKKTGRAIVADVMFSDYFNDLSGLDAIVSATGTSLSDYYVEYVLGSSIGSHDFAVPLVESVDALTNGNPGVREKIQLRHLSATGKGLRTDLAVDGLLVVSSDRSAPGCTLKTFSYASDKPFVSDTTKYLELDTPAGKPIVVKHFGKPGTAGVTNSGFFQIIINSSVTDSQHQEYELDAYLLVPPVMQISNGRVDFSHGVAYSSAQAPIAGFNVYLNGQKLNSSLLPVAAHVFFDSPIQAGSNVVVTVVDKYSNEWPEVPRASVPLHCSMAIHTNVVLHNRVIGYDDLIEGFDHYFDSPTPGDFSSPVFSVNWSSDGFFDRTDVGSLRFEVSADQTHILSFSGSLRESYLLRGDSYYWQASGGNLPIHLEGGRAIAVLRGAAACSAISKLEYKTYAADGSLHDDLKSFSCDEASSVRIVCE
ncbi:MAG: hypothetical protein IH627_02010 [Rubrivivax sp.]|nr:hypothetical protein [Rubrivivax sp.]